MLEKVKNIGLIVIGLVIGMSIMLYYGAQYKPNINSRSPDREILNIVDHFFDMFFSIVPSKDAAINITVFLIGAPLGIITLFMLKDLFFGGSDEDDHLLAILILIAIIACIPAFLILDYHVLSN
ncbi:MAG: hypothetical protein LBE27_05160 [Deltaproteobacteria bacterium]|jgi:hypothetical protein|nr:hypothetical protein [Deltaproteobacteria bacterium]